MSDLRLAPVNLYIVIYVKNIFTGKSWKVLKGVFLQQMLDSFHLATMNLIASCKPTIYVPCIVTGEIQELPVDKLVHLIHTPVIEWKELLSAGIYCCWCWISYS